jgi:hypothetical protein
VLDPMPIPTTRADGARSGSKDQVRACMCACVRV